MTAENINQDLLIYRLW